MAGKAGSEVGVPFPGREHRARGIELLVFLWLVVPSTMLQWFLDDPESIDGTLRVAATILGSLGLLALVCYFHWRSGEPWKRLGFDMSGWPGEALIGVVFFVPFVIVTMVVAKLLRSMGLPLEDVGGLIPPLSGTLQIVLSGLALVIVAVSEEVIFRGYLLLRVAEWRKGRTTLAVLASSAIFALGHQYQGLAGMMTVFTMGVLFSGIYLWRKSLVAPIVIHFLQNALAVAAHQQG
jgi:membrane protease YdiL (CAAX protease family)